MHIFTVISALYMLILHLGSTQCQVSAEKTKLLLFLLLFVVFCVALRQLFLEKVDTRFPLCCFSEIRS